MFSKQSKKARKVIKSLPFGRSRSLGGLGTQPHPPAAITTTVEFCSTPKKPDFALSAARFSFTELTFFPHGYELNCILFCKGPSTCEWAWSSGRRSVFWIYLLSCKCSLLWCIFDLWPIWCSLGYTWVNGRSFLSRQKQEVTTRTSAATTQPSSYVVGPIVLLVVERAPPTHWQSFPYSQIKKRMMVVVVCCPKAMLQTMRSFRLFPLQVWCLGMYLLVMSTLLKNLKSLPSVPHQEKNPGEVRATWWSNQWNLSCIHRLN